MSARRQSAAAPKPKSAAPKKGKTGPKVPNLDFLNYETKDNIKKGAVVRLLRRAGVKEERGLLRRPNDKEASETGLLYEVIVNDLVLGWTRKLVVASAAIAGYAQRQQVKSEDVILAASFLGKDVVAFVEKLTANSKGKPATAAAAAKEEQRAKAAAASNGERKKTKRGTVARRQIAKQQNSRRPGINYEGFRRELKKIAHDEGIFPTAAGAGGHTFPPGPVAFIQMIAEYVAVRILTAANIIARHSKRVGISASDITVAATLLPGLVPAPIRPVEDEVPASQ